jgi:hypothetical protein
VNSRSDLRSIAWAALRREPWAIDIAHLALKILALLDREEAGDERAAVLVARLLECDLTPFTASRAR